MKQPVITAGGRRWHGDEMVTFWNELHDAVEAIAESAGVCVLSGCAVSGSGPYTIAPGIVGISHATDGFKIVRYAGGSVSSLPAYMTVQATTTNKVYDDLLNHAAQVEYAATVTTTMPGGVPFLTLTAGQNAQFADGLMSHRIEALSSGTFNTGAGASGTYSFAINHATQMLLMRGSVTVNTSVPDPPLNVMLTSLPAGYVLAADFYFRGHIMHHLAYPPYDTAGQAFSDLTGRVAAGGIVSMCLRRPGSGSYTAHFNVQVPLY